MNDYEYLEAQGQATIFDFLPIKCTSRNKGFLVGDKVKIRYYADEIEYVQNCLPQMMGEGQIVAAFGTHYKVTIGRETVSVDGEKLILI